SPNHDRVCGVNRASRSENRCRKRSSRDPIGAEKTRDRNESSHSPVRRLRQTRIVILNNEIDALHRPDLVSLCGHSTALPASIKVETAYESFRAHVHEFIGVTQNGRMVGMISRSQISQLLSGQFGFALYARHNLLDHLLPGMVVVMEGTPLIEVLELALSRRDDEFHHDVALVDAHGAFLGIIPVPTLVRQQSRLIRRQMHLAADQSESLKKKNAELKKPRSWPRPPIAQKASFWQI
ncbi:MAG: rsbP 2, partial [Chthoniobacteraceae bacterium]|nr:rsbP 2 [Chthoniobacteraceae bacterium]